MKDVREILVPLFTLVKALEQAKADGKIDFSDVGFLMPLITQVGPAIEDAGEALKQWKEASPEDRAAEIVWAREKFEIEDKKLEAKIEAGLAMLIEAGVFLA